MLCLANYRLGNPEALNPCREDEDMLLKKRLPGDEFIWYSHAALHAMIGDRDKSLQLLQEAFDKSYKDCQWILMDINLKNIQDTPEFQALMKKYLPNGIK